MNRAQSNAFLTAIAILGTWTTFIRNQCFAANPYCNMNCTDGEHILCVEAPCKAKCENSQCHPPSTRTIQSFLRAANSFRSTAAAGGVRSSIIAENMRTLHWDRELELIAQCMLSNCDFEYPLKRTMCRKKLNQLEFRTNRFTFVEDVDKVEDGCPRLEAVVDVWANLETAKKIPEKQIKSFNSTMPDNFKDTLQMMWATTTKVGCSCRSFEKSVTQRRMMLFCNFAPVGLINGQGAFIIGSRSCDKYNLEKNAKYFGLCETKPEDLEPQDETDTDTDLCEYYPPEDNTTNTSSTTSTTMTATKNDATTTTGGTKNTAVPTTSTRRSTNKHVTTTRKLPSKTTTRRNVFTSRARSKVPSSSYDDRRSKDLWKTNTTATATRQTQAPSNEPPNYRTERTVWQRKTTIWRYRQVRNFTMFYFADLGLVKPTTDGMDRMRVLAAQFIHDLATDQSPRLEPGWVIFGLEFYFLFS